MLEVRAKYIYVDHKYCVGLRLEKLGFIIQFIFLVHHCFYHFSYYSFTKLTQMTYYDRNQFNKMNIITCILKS